MRALLVLFLFAAAPARAGDSALLDEVARLTPEVAAVMQLPAPKALRVSVVSREEGSKKLRASLAADYPGDALRRLGEALIATGLAAPSTDLPTAAPAFHGEHFSGFYDTAERTLFLVDDEPKERQRVIIAHELAHAFQDAHLGLEGLLRQRRHSEDALLALTAALEGQAQAVSAEVLKRVLLREHPGAAFTPDMEALLAASIASAEELAGQAPTPWLGLWLAFPYRAGRTLLGAVRTPGDPIGRQLWTRLPASTAQLLDPALYRAGVRPLAADLQLARLIPKGKRPWSTALGRAGVELLGSLRGAPALGEGWRGDRVESVQLGGKPVVVWAVRFDTPEQAAALAAALSQAPALPDAHLAHLGATVVLLSNVPQARRAAVLEAAQAAFR